MLLQNTLIDLDKFHEIYKNLGCVITPIIDQQLLTVYLKRELIERRQFWKRCTLLKYPHYARVACRGQINAGPICSFDIHHQYNACNRLKLINIDPLIALNSLYNNPISKLDHPTFEQGSHSLCRGETINLTKAFTHLISQRDIDILSAYHSWLNICGGKCDIIDISYVIYMSEPIDVLFDIVKLLGNNWLGRWSYNGSYKW